MKRVPNIRSRQKAKGEVATAAMSASNDIVSDIDNLTRDANREKAINADFAKAFSSEAGAEVLAYLRSITLDTALPPHEASDCALRHMEGSRYLVAIILNRTDRGHRKC